MQKPADPHPFIHSTALMVNVHKTLKIAECDTKLYFLLLFNSIVLPEDSMSYMVLKDVLKYRSVDAEWQQS